MVIVARKDLKLSAGKLAAQVAHAAVECTLRAKARKLKAVEEWLAQGQKKVVVKVDGLRALMDVKQAADELGYNTSLITDAGHTELAPGTTTCLGIGPDDEGRLDKLTGHLGLY